MEAQLKRLVTIEEFEAFISLPENSETIFELIAGQIYEVPSNTFASYIAGKILTFIGMYLLQNDIGYVTGADGGYMVGGDRYAPDVAYVSYKRQPELTKTGCTPNPPELAVEVISNPANSQEQEALRHKVANYLTVGTVVWVVNPETRVLEVYRIGTPVQIYNEAGTIEGGDVLPGFKLPVKDIFPPKMAEKEA